MMSIRKSPRRAGSGRLPWSARIAAAFLFIVALMATFAPLLSPYDPNRQNIPDRYAGWSWTHLLGTDALGRDNFTRMLYGAQTSLGIALLATLIPLIIAVPIGLYSGYKSKRVDQVVMRMVDALLSVPPLVAVLAIAVALGPGAATTVIALSIVGIPTKVRFIRNEARTKRIESYIEAAQISRLTTPQILRRHVFPNIMPPLLIASSFWFAGSLLAEAGLSFIGAGVQVPTASWGSMLRLGVDTSLFTDEAQFLVPGIAIALVILAANTLGEGIRSRLGWSSTFRRRRGDRNGVTSVADRPVGPVTSAGDPSDHAEPSALLEIRELSVEIDRPEADAVVALRNINLDIMKGEMVGLVGESGSGKTLTSLAIMRLLPSPPMRVTDGSVLWKGSDLLSKSPENLRRIRGAEIAMVFQDPMTSLDPTFTIGDQLISAYRTHNKVSRAVARARALELLDQVEVGGGSRRLASHPHELSGGMRQRVMIAMALSCNPDLLIADEATTALDVTVQAGIIDLLRGLQRELDLAMLVVTHDLGVVDDMCDRVAVMYAGQIVEENRVATFFEHPLHPYSEGLLRSNPRLDERRDRLAVLRGTVPSIDDSSPGCRFASRCDYVTDSCRSGGFVEFVPYPNRSGTRCVRHDELALVGEPG